MTLKTLPLQTLISLPLLFATSVAFAAPPLKLPWPCGTSYRITQGHNGGSHTGKGAWAWDIGIPVGGEVAAPADGTVRRIRMDSTSGGCDSAYANDANYVIIAFEDGTEALFLHLQANSSTLSVGDRVKAGDVVGRVGLTGWVCGAHLHFQIQETCSSWWCQSVQARFEEFGDPVSGSYTSDNCPPPPECARVATQAGETVVDELAPGCFEQFTTYWWSSQQGWEGHHYYTYGTPGPDWETYGRWSFDVGEDGRYLVEAYFPGIEADSRGATYVIDTGEAQVEVGPFDQFANMGWIALGTFDFTAGEDRSVTLGDNTGEAADDRRRVAYDAIRLVPAEPATDDPGPEEPATEDPTTTPDAGPPDGAPDDATSDMGFVEDDRAPSAETDDAYGPSVTTSEGCTSTPGAPSMWALLGILMGVIIRRR